MTTTEPGPPELRAEPGTGPAPSAPAGGPPRRARRWALALLSSLLCLLVLAAAALYGAVQTPRGTRLAWQVACRLSGETLHGDYMGGTLAHGVRLQQLEWRGAHTVVRLDTLIGQWALTRAPWRFSIDFLHLGTLQVQQLGSAPPSAPTPLPSRLTLPLQLTLRSVRVDRLLWQTGAGPAASTIELANLALHGSSDGQHHRLALDSVATPYGSLSGSAALDGVRPFKLSGALGFAGKVAAEPVEVSARAVGSLEQLEVDFDASGRQLAGRAHLEAMPFSAVPLKVVTLAADHLDLQAFDPGAPAADLSLRARLAPVASAGAAHASRSAAELVVAGPISIVNARAGSLGDHRLPLLEAQAQVRLDAREQRIDALQIHLFKGGTVSGNGHLEQGRGRFELQVAGLDANLLDSHLKPTQLAGALQVTLAPGVQQVAVDLADARAGLRLRTALRADPTQLTLSDTRLDAGRGQAQLSGTLKRDPNGSYALQVKLSDFDPLALLAPRAAAAGRPHAQARPSAQARRPPAPQTIAQAAPAARVSGVFALQGALAQASVKATLSLRDSWYEGVPLTGGGTVQWAGSRLLPSNLALSIAGNQLDLRGAFGARGDSLAFHLDATHLERLGLGLAGTAQADGRVTGSFAHPNVSASYSADALSLGDYRLGHAQGQAELHDGANGALTLSLAARDLNLPGLALHTVSANLSGTRASHALTLQALGTAHGQALDVALAAHGKLTDSASGSAWSGVVTQAANRGLPALQLLEPVTLEVSGDRLALGSTSVMVEGAKLELRQFLFDHGTLQSAGSVHNLEIDRLLQIQRDLTGANPPLKTDLVFDGNWDFALGDSASGYLQLQRSGGDITLNTWRGAAAMGFTELAARLDFAPGNRANLSLSAKAARIGSVAADLHTVLAQRGGILALTDEAPLSGTLHGDLPELRTTGGLFGPSYVLDGRLQLQLTVAGQVAHPELSGSISGNDLSATLIDQGIQFKQGVVRIALNNNLVQFQQVEFHGASGTLSASGRIKLDEANPDLAITVAADKLELFATPDRVLQLSGQASVRNAGTAGVAGGVAIDGKFKVDHALFDSPDSPVPELGSDVHIVKQDGSEVDLHKPPGAQAVQQAKQPAGALAPSANIAIDLGDAFRFKGAGADLGLTGKLVATSGPNQPLRAVGNVSVTPGSTYTAFGRKLSIDSGYFTFNGPIDNPGINILALRHNQEIEAGVQVSGTVQAPVAKLVSEPTVADNEKLSWLLFGHGTDTGANLGQQSTMNEAFALLGNAGGKRIAQSLGLDEFSIGQSEVGLTDPQVVTLSKALSERIVLGYEQGLTSAASVFKVTLNLSRFWSVALHTGAVNGATLLYNRRFD